jgi:hypothetical protein
VLTDVDRTIGHGTGHACAGRVRAGRCRPQVDSRPSAGGPWDIVRITGWLGSVGCEVADVDLPVARVSQATIEVVYCADLVRNAACTSIHAKEGSRPDLAMHLDSPVLISGAKHRDDHATAPGLVTNLTWAAS